MRTSFTKLLSVVALGALAACTTQSSTPATGSPEDEQAIRVVAEKYGAAYAARDTAALGQLVTEDYQDVMPDGRHTQGRAAFQALAAQELAMIPAGVTMSMSATTAYVRFIDANHAVAGGTWSVSPGAPGMPSKGSWMAMMVKQDTVWRMGAGLGSPDLTSMAPADTTRKP